MFGSVSSVLIEDLTVFLSLLPQELLVQGDQLDNIERRTDEITNTMTATQKHLNNIRSMFGGVKNFFSRGKDKAAEEIPQPPPRQSRLKETVSQVEKDRPRNPNIDYSGLQDDTSPTDLDSKFLAGSRRPEVQKAEYIRRITNSQQEMKMNQNLGKRQCRFFCFIID